MDQFDLMVEQIVDGDTLIGWRIQSVTSSSDSVQSLLLLRDHPRFRVGHHVPPEIGQRLDYRVILSDPPFPSGE